MNEGESSENNHVTVENNLDSWLNALVDDFALKAEQGYHHFHSQRISGLEAMLERYTEGWRQSLNEISLLIEEKDSLVALLASEKKILNDLRFRLSAMSGQSIVEAESTYCSDRQGYTVQTEPVTPVPSEPQVIPFNTDYFDSPFR